MVNKPQLIEKEMNLCANIEDRKEEYEKISVMIDSGASETVAPIDKFGKYADGYDGDVVEALSCFNVFRRDREREDRQPTRIRSRQDSSGHRTDERDRRQQQERDPRA